MDRKTSQGQIPLKSWQVMKSCRRILGDSFMQGLFRRGICQLQRWSTDPDFSEVDRNPLDHYETMLRRLMELGREDVARAAVDRQAHIVGCELVCTQEVLPDHQGVEAECLDDYPALVAFHHAIRVGEPPESVRHFWQSAKREIDETFKIFLDSDEPGSGS